MLPRLVVRRDMATHAQLPLPHEGGLNVMRRTSYVGRSDVPPRTITVRTTALVRF